MNADTAVGLDVDGTAGCRQSEHGLVTNLLTGISSVCHWENLHEFEETFLQVAR